MPELLLDFLLFKIHLFTIMSSHSRDRIVVSTLRCGRSNPGSNPGHGKTQSFFSIFLLFQRPNLIGHPQHMQKQQKRSDVSAYKRANINWQTSSPRKKLCVIKGMFALSPLHDGCDIEKTVLHIRYCEICFRIALYYCTSVQKCRHEF